MAPKIRLDAAALATTKPILPHQQAAWNWLQEQLTEPEVTQFAELFRAAPAVKEPLAAVAAAAPQGPPIWPPGMVGPKIRPNLKPGDHHLIANDVNETLTAWTHDGRRLWRIPCLCRGQGKEAEWSIVRSLELGSFEHVLHSDLIRRSTLEDQIPRSTTSRRIATSKA